MCEVSRCVSVCEGGWGIVYDAAASNRSGSIADVGAGYFVGVCSRMLCSRTYASKPAGSKKFLPVSNHFQWLFVVHLVFFALLGIHRIQRNALVYRYC